VNAGPEQPVLAAFPVRLIRQSLKYDTMDILQISELSRRFGDTVAVDALTIAIAAGEIFGMLGPNGAGKTPASACHREQMAAG
jgi:ABC-type uncharacterized transport system ATPase subunit